MNYKLLFIFTGNTSDNLEAVSEAASNHSVASSLELENDQNDNLSDMVSANVSGRGTPNISGKHILHLVEYSTDLLGKDIVIWVKVKFPMYTSSRHEGVQGM
jgi:hypothetical protein